MPMCRAIATAATFSRRRSRRNAHVSGNRYCCYASAFGLQGKGHADTLVFRVIEVPILVNDLTENKPDGH